MPNPAKFLLLLLTIASFAAPSRADEALWQPAPPGFTEKTGPPALLPARYAVFTADEAALEAALARIPQQYNQSIVILLPMPEGSFRTFRVWATPVMAPALAARYPDIATFTAEAADNHQVTAKLDYTPFGFHAMIYDGERTCFIDPYDSRAGGAYLVYYKKDYSRPGAQGLTCGTDAPHKVVPARAAGNRGARRVSGTMRKKYRLALACTAEYAAAVAGPAPTKAAVLAKMVTSLHRVNGVYERELALTMELVAKEDTLIFLDAATEPYTDANAAGMQGQNQATVNARIGFANYDIGHVFSHGGGAGGAGIAQQRSVCDTFSKAEGVTGSLSPVGDAFDIDFVAHEMGHQYGASHTFNGSTAACANNGVEELSFEPGSGSTIMAYAGICGSGDNVQAHSDAYFHSASLEEITDYITLPNTGGVCPATTPSPNAHNAALPAFGSTYNIPYKTPFELTVLAATDADADSITYCWEQRDAGGIDFGRSLSDTHLQGPLFRSFPPQSAATRVFPALRSLIYGIPSPGEKLPDTGRSLRFRITERDVYAGWGAFTLPDDAITLHAIATSGPFIVTAPAAGATWSGGSRQTISWNAANTTAAPVSCAAVDIYLSADSGYTYPYLLATATPNDGSETIMVPNPPGGIAAARIKVKGAGNVFFNISAGIFRIAYDSLAALPEGIYITPVPATADLMIQVSGSSVAEARMVNLLGQTVWAGAVSGRAVISVGGFARGMYYMRLRYAGRQETRPVLLR